MILLLIKLLYICRTENILNMKEIVEYREESALQDEERRRIVEFLHTHLEEFKDSKEDIDKSIDYVFSGEKGKGGFLLVGFEDDQIVGVVIMNKTGMVGYIPENILVYIATHNAYRGRGFGKKLLQKAVDMAEGNVALHVEPDNPAKYLYEKAGFTNKYLEMRLEK